MTAAEAREPSTPQGLEADVSVFKSTTGHKLPFLRIRWQVGASGEV